MPEDPLTTRRTLLGGSAAVVLLAGCDTGDGTPGGTPDSSAVSRPDDADVTLAAEVLLAVEAIAAWCRAAARRHPGEPRWPALTSMHRAHLRALTPEGSGESAAGAGDGGGSTTAPSEVPRDPATALRTGRARLQEHQDRLVAAAVAASSGALARLLAAMAAAVAQRLADWPTASTRSPAGSAATEAPEGEA